MKAPKKGKLLYLYGTLSWLFFIHTSYATNLPEMGNSVNETLNLKQEKIIGQEFYRSLLKKNLVLHDPETLDYLQHIGNTLVNQLENNIQNFTFFIVKDHTINAFATPGGYIGVNTGLIAASQNEDELAAVLAHEIAHVHQRHIARHITDMQSKQFISLATILTGIIAASQGYNQEASALFYSGIATQTQQAIKFTRENEIEADRIGINLLSNTEYSPAGMVSFFKIMQRQNNNTALRPYQHLLTHPLDQVRIAEAENRIAQLPKTALHNTKKAVGDYIYTHARISALNANDRTTLLQVPYTSSPQSQYKRAQAYEMNQQWQAAESIYQQLLKGNNKMPFVLGLSRSYIKLKKFAKACELLTQHIKIQPDNFALNIYLAQARLHNHQSHLAIAQINTYLRRSKAPVSAEIYQLLAMAYSNTQQRYLAQKSQVEYLYHNGNYRTAIGLLQSLIKDKTVEATEKQRLESRLQDIIKTQKAIKALS